MIKKASCQHQYRRVHLFSSMAPVWSKQDCSGGNRTMGLKKKKEKSKQTLGNTMKGKHSNHKKLPQLADRNASWQE